MKETRFVRHIGTEILGKRGVSWGGRENAERGKGKGRTHDHAAEVLVAPLGGDLGVGCVGGGEDGGAGCGGEGPGVAFFGREG